MGESALVVGDSTAIKVHVHLPNPGDAISYGAEKDRNLEAIAVETGGAVFDARQAAYQAHQLTHPTVFLNAMRDTYWVAVGLLLIAMVSSLVRGPREKPDVPE